MPHSAANEAGLTVFPEIFSPQLNDQTRTRGASVTMFVNAVSTPLHPSATAEAPAESILVRAGTPVAMLRVARFVPFFLAPAPVR